MDLTSHLPLAALNFSTLPEQVVNGLLLGAIYALIALGYTMVYGVLKLINFAHGEVYMLGAYIALFASYLMGYTPAGLASGDPKPFIAQPTLQLFSYILLAIGAVGVAASFFVKVKPQVYRLLGAFFVIMGALSLLISNYQPVAINLVIMLLASMIVCAIVGILIERFAYRPMRSHSRIASLITAIGISLLLQYGGALFLPNSPPPSISEKVNPIRTSITWFIVAPPAAIAEKVAAAKPEFEAAKADYDAYIARTHEGQFNISAEGRPIRDRFQKAERSFNEAEREAASSGVSITFQWSRIIMFIAVILLMGGLTYLVLYTPSGRAMRAVSHDFDSASLMGIDVNRIVTFTFILGSSLAGAGAMMTSSFLGTPLTTFYGLLPGVKAFVAAVLGGIGNIPGAVVGGLLMGLAENLVVWAGYSDYKDSIAFVILIAVLLFKPGGILGSSKVEKV